MVWHRVHILHEVRLHKASPSIPTAESTFPVRHPLYTLSLHTALPSTFTGGSSLRDDSARARVIALGARLRWRD